MERKSLWPLLLCSVTVVSLLRRWGKTWGATYEEAHSPLPSDSIVPHPMLETTHAITIRARPAQVWPWIVQMGYYRGGWYTDTDWWDFLADRYLRFMVREEVMKTGQAHRDEPSASRIIPEFQRLEVGDVILDGPPGTAFFTVAAHERNRLLALYSTSHLRFVFPKAVRDNPQLRLGGEFSWVFVLREMANDSTRLILRTRANAHPRPYLFILDAFLPVVDLVMARKMLSGIKQRAEQTLRPTSSTYPVGS